MTKQAFPKTISLTLGVLTMAFLISIAVLAWTEPTVGPPGSNVDAPLNIGSSDQIKQGGLTIGATSGVIRIGSGAYQLAKDGLSLAFKNNAGTTKMIIGDNGNVDIEGLLTIDNGGGDALVIEKGGDLVIYNSDDSGSAKFYVDNNGEIITPNKLKVGGDLEVSGTIKDSADNLYIKCHNISEVSGCEDVCCDYLTNLNGPPANIWVSLGVNFDVVNNLETLATQLSEAGYSDGDSNHYCWCAPGPSFPCNLGGQRLRFECNDETSSYTIKTMDTTGTYVWGDGDICKWHGGSAKILIVSDGSNHYYSTEELLCCP